MDYTILGKNVSKARGKKGITQEVLAEAIDVSTVFISQIETAARKPSLETIYKISVALQIPIDSLIENHIETARYTELLALINGKTNVELKFITNIVRELCKGIADEKIIQGM